MLDRPSLDDRNLLLALTTLSESSLLRDVEKDKKSHLIFELCQVHRVREVPNGGEIYDRSDDRRWFSFIAQGSVRVDRRLGARSAYLKMLGRGDCFGELEILTPNSRPVYPHKSNLRVYRGPVRLVEIDGEHFRGRIYTETFRPALANLIALLIAKIEHGGDMFIRGLPQSKGQIIAQALIELIETGCFPTVEQLSGGRLRQVRIDTGEVELLLGVSRKAVSALIHDFREPGICNPCDLNGIPWPETDALELLEANRRPRYNYLVDMERLRNYSRTGELI